jgi:translation initiation factor IF-3
MDYGKWRYQQQKKEDKSRAHRGGQLKEVKLRTVRIGDHDLEIKINRARDFLKEGHKVQFTLQFRGREMTHLELGREIFAKVKQELAAVSKVERDAKMEGRRMILILQPDHKTPAATNKGGGGEGARRAPAMSAGSRLEIPAATAAAPQPASAGS